MTIGPRIAWLRAAVWALAGVLVLLAALTARQVTRLTCDALEANWRGRFDILVTAPGAENSLSPGQDSEGLALLDPNFANASTPTMSLDQVRAIAELNDVDVAAPIGFLGSMADSMNWPLFFIPISELSKPTTEYRINWRVAGSDGLGDRLVMDEYQSVTISMTDWNGQEGRLGEVGVRATSTDPNMTFDGYVWREGIELSWWPVPVFRSSIFAVDPVAEKALLGSDGEFLQPLADFDALIAENGPISHHSFHNVEHLQDSIPLEAALKDLPGAQVGHRAALWGAYGLDSPFVGYLRNTQPYAPTELVATVEELVDGQYVNIGERSIDLAEVMRPFNGSELEIGWPRGETATTLDIERYFVADYASDGISPLSLTPIDGESEAGQEPRFTVEPQGIQYAIPRMAFAPPDGAGIGQEQSYRNTLPGELRIGGLDREGAAPFEVGTYTPKSLDAGISYVPLGAYDPATVTVTDTGQVLTPTRNALGLPVQSASAIVSLRGAQELASGDFISAVRVRVAGLEGLNRADAMVRIDALAGRIRALGLDAYVVAGSALQPVQLWVPDYAFGTNTPGQSQRVGDLGWVTQEFTTLGAATWSESTTARLVGWLSLGSMVVAALSLVASGWLARPDRGHTHALLRSLGWSVPARLWWAIREEWPGIAVALGASLVALILGVSGQWLLPLGIVGAAMAVTLLVSNPLRPKAEGLSATLGTRRRRIGLATVETVSAAAVATAFALMGIAAQWYVVASSRTRLSSAITELVVSLAGVVGVLIALVCVVQLVATRLGDGVRARLAHFRYWNLGTSASRIRVGRAVPALLMAGCAAVPVVYALSLAGSHALPLSWGTWLGLGWLGFWVIVKLATALGWRPMSASR